MSFERDVEEIVRQIHKQENQKRGLNDRAHGVISNVLQRLVDLGKKVHLDRANSGNSTSWKVTIEDLSFPIHSHEFLEALQQDPNRDLGEFVESLIVSRLRSALD